jgi:hypothetical protein
MKYAREEVEKPWVNLVRLAVPQPGGTPHPVSGCLCREGRLIEYRKPYREMVVAWLPPVHDCQYVRFILQYGRRAWESSRCSGCAP